MEWPPNYAEQFWREYPRRVAKKAALASLERVRRSGEVSFARLMEGVRIYAAATAGKDIQFVCHPATWLNQGRWDDEPAAIAGNSERATTADNARSLLTKLFPADHAAHEQGGSDFGNGADDERIHDVPLHRRIDLGPVRSADVVPAGNCNGSSFPDPWGSEEVQGLPPERGTTH